MAKRPPVGGSKRRVASERKAEVDRPVSRSMGDESATAADGPAEDPPSDAADEDEEWVPMEGLSDEGVLLFFAGVACLLATVTAATRGQPEPVVAFGAAAGAVGLLVVAVDLLSGYVPGQWTHLAVGGGALLAAGFAAAGRHYVNVATFGVAAALVLWRAFDLEVLDTA